MRRAALLVVLLLLAGCGGSPTSAPADAGTTIAAPPSAKPALRYVALGDSYSAAPYVYLTDAADGCLRSDHNYPSQVAKKLGATLTDVTCSGATTSDLTSPQKTFGTQTVAPQLDAVGSSTQLVTVGIGGNDDALFGSLSAGCPITGPSGTPVGVPPKAGVRCGEIHDDFATTALATIRKNVASVLKAIKAKAPDAKVILVGYPRLASTTTTCPDQIPATLADAKNVDRVTHDLSDTMRAAAKATGTTFIDMYAASKGHDICAGTAAWVNGVHTDTERAAALHPFLAEQEAVAERVEKAVGR